MEIFEKYNRVKPQNVVADSGYGSEENYAFCEEKKMKAYVKYNTFEKRTKEGVDETNRSRGKYVL